MSIIDKPGAPQRRPFVFRIGFQGKPDTAIDATAYLFNRAGALIASAPLKNGTAAFPVSEAELRRALVRRTDHPGRPARQADAQSGDDDAASGP